jgi:3-dehydroquinate dehydratase-2
MTRRVLVLNGPNLSRLGSREPEVYGTSDHAALVARVRRVAAELDLEAEVRQSDDEADIVRWLHEAVDTDTPVVINPAAFTHYSYALRDAAALVTRAGLPLVEVHLSNPGAREAFRRQSVVTSVATGTVAGFGQASYDLALRAVAESAAPAGSPT